MNILMVIFREDGKVLIVLFGMVLGTLKLGGWGFLIGVTPPSPS